MSGFVYFIAPEALLHRDVSDSGRIVKIGYTTGNPQQRLNALQTGSPLVLKVWAFTPGSEALERAFHETFAQLRSHGEWFMVHDRLYALMGLIGNEPHTGRMIPPDQMSIAIRDALLCDVPDYECDDLHLWDISAYPAPLQKYYPEAFR